MKLQLAAYLLICAVMACSVDGMKNEAQLDYESSMKFQVPFAEDLISESAKSMLTAEPGTGEIYITGDTSILATLKSLGKGDVLSLTDSDTENGIIFGTNAAMKGFMSVRPTKGTGFAITNNGSKIGIFVSSEDAKVGIATAAPREALEVNGNVLSNGFIEATAGGAQNPAIKLTGVTDYYGIQFNTDGDGQYLIGRGTGLKNRELSFHIPTSTSYGGGSQPSFKWSSGGKMLASLEASTGNMYIRGNLGIGTLTPKGVLDVRGNLNIEGPSGEAIINFPVTGKNAGFYIRSSADPNKPDAADERLFINNAGRVGIRTLTPKAMLDVRGHLNLEDASQAAVIYFRKTGSHANLYIRSLDTPDTYDAASERFTITSTGFVGVGTATPQYGITIDTPADKGDPRNDLAVKKGHIYLSGAIYDTFGGTDTYFLDLKNGGFVKNLNVETKIGVGTTSPVGASDSTAVLHISDPNEPVLKLESGNAGSGYLRLSTGGKAWDTIGNIDKLSIGYGATDAKKDVLFVFSKEGNFGIGPGIPTHGITVASAASAGDKRNDIAITKGHLRLSGSIYQTFSAGDDWYLNLEKDGHINHLNIDGNLGVGLADKTTLKHRLEIAGGDDNVSIGNNLFLNGGGMARISSNCYRDSGKWKVHDSTNRSGLIQMTSDATVELMGTAVAGSIDFITLFGIDAVKNIAYFPNLNEKVGIGTKAPLFPLHVIGKSAIGKSSPTIAFGSADSNVAYLGTNSDNLYIASKDGTPRLSISQKTGNVGVGTESPLATLHIEADSQPTFRLSSKKSNAAGAYSYMQAIGGDGGVNMILGVANSSGKTGLLTFDFPNTITLSGGGGTIFKRGDTIFASGNVGIGINNPLYALHVAGDVRVHGKVIVSRSLLASDEAAAKAKNPAQLLLLEESASTEDNTVDMMKLLSNLANHIQGQQQRMEKHDKKMAELQEHLAKLIKE